MNDPDEYRALAYAYGEPEISAQFRVAPEDFVVDEKLGFSLSGEGEHLYVQLTKRGENTHWVAEKLAQYFRVKPVAVGTSGKKDRHAVTTQWFSIHLPGVAQDVDWHAFKSQFDLNIEVMQSARHGQKLRTGTHVANEFCITLHHVSDVGNAIARLESIAAGGVPNYFGEQRFGRNGSNIHLARAWFERGEQIRQRGKRSMVMSAGRALLFNRVLSHRVDLALWQSSVDGDDLVDALPTGPLWGRGRSPVQARAADLEQEVLEPYALWCDKLEHLGLKQERRTLQLAPQNLSWETSGTSLRLSFGLAPGQFATSVLRELCQLNNCAAPG